MPSAPCPAATMRSTDGGELQILARLDVPLLSKSRAGKKGKRAVAVIVADGAAVVVTQDSSERQGHADLVKSSHKPAAALESFGASQTASKSTHEPPKVTVPTTASVEVGFHMNVLKLFGRLLE